MVQQQEQKRNTEEASPKKEGQAVLNEKYIIFQNKPLPHLDSENCLGFAASPIGENNSSLFALVFHPKTPPRMDVLNDFKSIHDPNLQNLIEWGVVEWSQPYGKRIALILEEVQGKRIFQRPHDELIPFSEDELLQGVLIPANRIFETLSAKNQSHRAITLSNVFLCDKERRQICFGECFSTLPGERQSVLFETIETGMSNPFGRGPGSISNDLYALGVLITFLALGKNTLCEASDTEIIDSKIMNGSFSAIIGAKKIPISLMEPVRGLLADDVSERWTLKDLKMWIDGRRMMPRQASIPRRAPRPFIFEDKSYYQLPILLKDLAHTGAKGLEVIKSMSFLNWLKRNLNAEALVVDLENMIESMSKGNSLNSDKMLAKILIYMMPSFPICYKSMTFTIDGIAGAFIKGLEHSEIKQILSEMITQRLPVSWLSSQEKVSPNHAKYHVLFDKLPKSISSNNLGHGYERCLYELNPLLPCMSPLLRDFVVSTIQQLLPSLEALAQKAKKEDCPYDRHILAFITVQAKAAGEVWVNEFRINADHNKEAFGILKLYSLINKRHGIHFYPHLAKWIAQFRPNGLIQLNNLRLQKEITKELDAYIQKGDLQAMFHLIDDSQLIEGDKQEYQNAQKTYEILSNFVQLIQNEKENIEKVAQSLGSRIASFICLILSIIGTIILMLVMV